MTYRDEVEEHLSAVEELRRDQLELILLGVKLGLEAAAARASELTRAGVHAAAEIRDIHPGHVLVAEP